MKSYILAVDPGVSGGMACYRNGEITLRKFTDEDEFISYIKSHGECEQAVVEHVPKYIGNQMMASHSFTLGYNMGFEVGAIKSLNIPVDLVRPQKWQGSIPGLKGMTGHKRKRLLKEHAMGLYPSLKITLATADALLILNHYMKKL
jgi:hypothetical protein